MEEDLKILIAFRNYNKFYKEENGKLLIAIDLDIKTELDKAIENLLTRYKQLENKINQLNNYILTNGIDERLKTATQIQVENQHEYLHLKQVERLKERIEQLKENTIPKSKIKEKIEELKKDLERDRICIDFVIEHTKDIELMAEIKVLQELLEEE